jgi:hypothetical protein
MRCQPLLLLCMQGGMHVLAPELGALAVRYCGHLCACCACLQVAKVQKAAQKDQEAKQKEVQDCRSEAARACSYTMPPPAQLDSKVAALASREAKLKVSCQRAFVRARAPASLLYQLPGEDWMHGRMHNGPHAGGRGTHGGSHRP